MDTSRKQPWPLVARPTRAAATLMAATSPPTESQMGKPTRSGPAVPAETLPAELAFLLVDRVGLSREQIAAMTKAEAIERLNRYWTEGM